MNNKKIYTDKKIVTFGEIMLRLTTPQHLRFAQARSFVATFGGSEANVAASLVNFGLPTELVTRLPQNPVSQSCINEIRSKGMGTDGIIFGGNRIGSYYLESGTAFRNSNVVYDRADSSFAQLKPGMIDWERVFSNAGWFHWSGITPSVSQGCADACQEAIEVADKMGLTISCDLNYRKKMWNYGKDAADVMAPLVQYSDVMFAAEPEYEKIFGLTPVGFKATDDKDRTYFDKLPEYKFFCSKVSEKVPRCKKVFLELRNSMTSTHNLLAAMVYSQGEMKSTSIYDIDNIVDCVGTGDAFVGGLIYGLIKYPDDDQKAVNFALAASALKNTYFGDFNLATVQEIEELMDSNKW